MNEDQAGQFLGSVLSLEAQALQGFILGPEAPRLVLGVALIVLIQFVVRILLARWGRGDGRQDLTNVLSLAIRLLAWLFAVVFFLHGFFKVAPLLTTSGILLSLSGLAFGWGMRLQDWLLGWLVILRGYVRVGDHLEVSDAQGEVVRLGLMRVLLKAEDGARVLLPTRALTEGCLRLSTQHQSVPVDFAFDVPTEGATEALQRAKHIAGLCPYRSWHSEVTVAIEGPNVRIRLQAWSAPAAEEAQAYLRDAFAG
jgi:small-conductance mechanosensitive channel